MDRSQILFSKESVVKTGAKRHPTPSSKPLCQLCLQSSFQQSLFFQLGLGLVFLDVFAQDFLGD
jgi:hypothetical protein